MNDTPKPGIRLADGLSALADPISAAKQAAERAGDLLDSLSADLVIVSVTAEFASRVGMIADVIRSHLSPKNLLIVTAAGIMGGATELHDKPGVSVMAMHLPGVDIHPFWIEHLAGNATIESRAASIANTIGASDQLRAVLFFADPFSVPLVNLVPALSSARVEYVDRTGQNKPIGTILGGMASAATRPGGNALYLNGELHNEGAMGVTLSGPLRVDTVVSQGCRPIGEPMVVTRARGNLILELAGHPAVEVIRETVQLLDQSDKELMGNGLLLGRVIHEHKARFGRGDFLIRNIMGGDDESGAVAVADLMRAGQTIQLHLHDEQTAREDLQLLLDGQRLYDKPAGAFVVSCNGRTDKFFGEGGHDAKTICHAFDQPLDGARQAKTGTEVDASAGIPVSGFFAAGEIAPLGDGIFHHGHTVVAAMFRQSDI
jgi:small ligand-binding sensory domain FIST